MRSILDRVLAVSNHTGADSCVLDWNRREGFLKTSVVLASGRHWYVIGYMQELGGPVVRVCINPRRHVEDLSEMPLSSAREFFRFYRKAKQLLGISGRPRNIYANLGGPDSGMIIGGHFHLNMAAAPVGNPSSGMGLNLVRVMYDKLDELVSAMLADLETLATDAGATVDVYAERVAYWQEQRRQFVTAKEKADAFRR